MSKLILDKEIVNKLKHQFFVVRKEAIDKLVKPLYGIVILF